MHLSNASATNAHNGRLWSIVVLNWNSKRYLEECLRSIAQQNSELTELILVDNHSEPDNLVWVQSLVQDLLPDGFRYQIIELPENLGFAGGMNRGLERAQGDWLVALNSDACLSDQFVDELNRYIHRTESEPGLVAIPVKKWIHTETLDHFTQELWSTGSCLNLRASVAAWTEGIDPLEFLLGCDGSAQIFSRKLYNAVRVDRELYAERYGSYGEDLDLYLRARQAGFKTSYCSSVSVWHIGSASAAHGIQGFSAKNLVLRKAVLQNKWRNIYKFPVGAQRTILFAFSLLEDALRGRGLGGWKGYFNMHIVAKQELKLDSINVKIKPTLFSRMVRPLKVNFEQAMHGGRPPGLKGEL